MWLHNTRVLKITDTSKKKHQDHMIMDVTRTLVLNDTPLVSFSTIPTNEKELAVGYLFAHNHITSMSDIQSIKVLDGTIHIDTLPATIPDTTPSDALSSSDKISFMDIFHLTAQFQEKALLFKETAICESAGLFNGSSILYYSEDLDRDNAIYKAVGLAKIDGYTGPLSLITSDKITKDTIQQAIQIGVPLIISRTGITFSAYQLAERHNITLIGFARGKKFSIYCGEHRIS